MYHIRFQYYNTTIITIGYVSLSSFLKPLFAQFSSKIFKGGGTGQGQMTSPTERNLEDHVYRARIIGLKNVLAISKFRLAIPTYETLPRNLHL